MWSLQGTRVLGMRDGVLGFGALVAEASRYRTQTYKQRCPTSGYTTEAVFGLIRDNRRPMTHVHMLLHCLGHKFQLCSFVLEVLNLGRFMHNSEFEKWRASKLSELIAQGSGSSCLGPDPELALNVDRARLQREALQQQLEQGRLGFVGQGT